MIKIEHTDVYGFESAIRGMRNPMNSWDKSDSFWKVDDTKDRADLYVDGCGLVIGENDLKLMKSLSKAGSDHGKFLRMINVTLDITAPLYWWKEFDTYKVGTVANSCSTMHKIHAKEFVIEDFSCEHLLNMNCDLFTTHSEDGLFHTNVQPIHFLNDYVIPSLNVCREKYLNTNNKEYWWQMIQLLPSSYNQRRTVQLNYQVLKSLYPVRKAHKLDEWVEFCKWCESLPYFKEICIEP